MTTPLETQSRRRWGTMITIGLIGGLLSGLFAIGGGIIMVPLLTTFARLNSASPRRPPWRQSYRHRSSARSPIWWPGKSTLWPRHSSPWVRS